MGKQNKYLKEQNRLLKEQHDDHAHVAPKALVPPIKHHRQVSQHAQPEAYAITD